MKRILLLLFVFAASTVFAQRDVAIKGKLDVNASTSGSVVSQVHFQNPYLRAYYKDTDTNYSFIHWDRDSEGGLTLGRNAAVDGSTAGGVFLRFQDGGITWRLGSDATGDLYTRNASGYFSRIAVGTTGAFLRAGTTPSWSTLTIPNTISANSIFVANSANTLVELTPAAGQSIRRNAGGTAWEAYTPSGSGVTLGTTRQLPFMNSGGTDFIYEAGFEYNGTTDYFTTPNITLGNSSASGGRTIDVQSSSANAGILFLAKGNGSFSFLTDGTGSLGVQNSTSGNYVNLVPDVPRVVFSSETLGGSVLGPAGVSTNVHGKSLSLKGGDAYTTGNNNGGDLVLAGGAKNGTGTEGSVYVTYGSTGSFRIDGRVQPVLLSGTSLTLNDDLHRGKIIYCTSSSTVTITIPTGLPLGFQCTIWQDGSGTVNITTSGTTLNGKSSTTAQYDAVNLLHYKSSETYLGI